MKFLILKCFCLLPSAFCILFLSGCEWTTGGGAQTWSDRVATDEQGRTIDFSGSYKDAGGNILVRKFGGGAHSITNTTTITNSVAGELMATGNGTNTVFSGVLAHPPPIPGTLTIIVGGYQFNDPGSASAGTVALTVTPSDGSAGTINLDTGVWALSFPAAIANGTQILAAYQYLVTTILVTAAQGNHGDPIYSFILYQEGNTIQLIDDNGSKYQGYIGNVIFGPKTDVGWNEQATEASAQLNVNGFSQGYNVQIVGTLKKSTIAAPYISYYDQQGNPVWATRTSGSYTMLATFIEEGGYSADIAAIGPVF